MKKILLIAPLSVNGGIASWAKNYMATFKDAEFQLIALDSSSKYRSPNDTSLIKRVFIGLLDLIKLRQQVKTILNNEKFCISHVTTSGNIGSFRDIVIGHILKKKNCKIILHCHYGCLSEDIKNGFLIGFFLRKALALYDQIWVLDKNSYKTLGSFSKFKNKVCLTPNPIRVQENVDFSQKNYKNIVFIGNVIPEKGIFELLHAVLMCDIRLDIVGPAKQNILSKIYEIAERELNHKIFYHGKMPNDKAMAVLERSDILALPSYYPFEAFPISILEAMSLAKLVISTNRAAIPDILTDKDGSLCGIIVKEKSVDEIVNAINFCQQNSVFADQMCIRAYEKVKNSYSAEVVYRQYKDNYRLLFAV